MTIEKIKFYFKKVGYKKGSIINFWYSNPAVIKDKLDRVIPTLGQSVEKVIRWETDAGKIALKTIHNFITEKLEETKRINSENFRNKIYNSKKTIIDFNEILIENMSINDYMYSKIKHYYSTSGWNDLCGISLENFWIQNAIIRNAVFSFGSFDGSTLQGLVFENCNLNSCSFNDCHLSYLKVDSIGSLQDCSWINSTINVIEISSKNFGVNPNYSRIGYFSLIKIAITGKIEKKEKRNYTDFSSCEILNDDNSLQFKEHSDYINWYQSTIYKYSKINTIENSWLKNSIRITNILNALSTKNWYSPSITILSGAFITFLFSLLYYFFRDLFQNIDSYSKALNLSIHIFTSLGFSIILPNKDNSELALWIISFECILGYIWLALTMMVFGRKIFK